MQLNLDTTFSFYFMSLFFWSFPDWIMSIKWESMGITGGIFDITLWMLTQCCSAIVNLKHSPQWGKPLILDPPTIMVRKYCLSQTTLALFEPSQVQMEVLAEIGTLSKYKKNIMLHFTVNVWCTLHLIEGQSVPHPFEDSRLGAYLPSLGLQPVGR